MKMMKKIAACFAAAAVASVSVAAMGMQASATDEPPYTAYLCASIGGVAQWSAGEWETETATITTDGSYSTSVVIPDPGSETIDFLMLTTDINAYAFVEEGGDPLTEGTANITIDSIKIIRVGTETEDTIQYNGPSANALFLNDDGSTLRVNILNTWAPAQYTEDIDTTVDGGLAVGDTLVVNFTVSGISAGGGMAETEEESSSDSSEDSSSSDSSDDSSSSSDSSSSDDTSSDSDSSDSSSDSNSSSSNSSSSSSSSSNSTSSDGSASSSSDDGESDGETGSNSTSNNSSTNSGGTSSNSGGSSSSNSGGSSSSNSSSGSTTNNATTSETGDFGIAAVALGAVAAAALGVGAFTATRKKK